MIVKVPSETSSGLRSLFLAFIIKSLADLHIPSKLSWSAFLITGTIKFPFPRAVAIPMLISFLSIKLLSDNTAFREGNSLRTCDTIFTNG